MPESPFKQGHLAQIINVVWANNVLLRMEFEASLSNGSPQNTTFKIECDKAPAFSHGWFDQPIKGTPNKPNPPIEYPPTKEMLSLLYYWSDQVETEHTEGGGFKKTAVVWINVGKMSQFVKVPDDKLGKEKRKFKVTFSTSAGSETEGEAGLLYVLYNDAVDPPVPWPPGFVVSSTDPNDSGLAYALWFYNTFQGGGYSIHEDPIIGTIKDDYTWTFNADTTKKKNKTDWEDLDHKNYTEYPSPAVARAVTLDVFFKKGKLDLKVT